MPGFVSHHACLEVEAFVGLHINVKAPDIAVAPPHLWRCIGVPVSECWVAAHDLVHLPKVELHTTQVSTLRLSLVIRPATQHFCGVIRQQVRRASL